jgi:hypothetical protein
MSSYIVNVCLSLVGNDQKMVLIRPKIHISSKVENNKSLSDYLFLVLLISEDRKSFIDFGKRYKYK